MLTSSFYLARRRTNGRLRSPERDYRVSSLFSAEGPEISAHDERKPSSSVPIAMLAIASGAPALNLRTAVVLMA